MSGTETTVIGSGGCAGEDQGSQLALSVLPLYSLHVLHS